MCNIKRTFSRWCCWSTIVVNCSNNRWVSVVLVFVVCPALLALVGPLSAAFWPTQHIVREITLAVQLWTIGTGNHFFKSEVSCISSSCDRFRKAPYSTVHDLTHQVQFLLILLSSSTTPRPTSPVWSVSSSSFNVFVHTTKCVVCKDRNGSNVHRAPESKTGTLLQQTSVSFTDQRDLNPVPLTPKARIIPRPTSPDGPGSLFNVFLNTTECVVCKEIHGSTVLHRVPERKTGAPLAGN